MEIIQYSLPQRQAYIKQLQEGQVKDSDYQLSFQGKLRNFPVYTVDIGLPCYRLNNGRTRAEQLEVIATEKLHADFFQVDPDSEPALLKQDEILRQMVSDAGLLKAFKTVEQDQPLILDKDGYVINGNRRLCAMRLLLQQDEVLYKRFKHIQVIFLPPCTERDIKELEGRLQVQPELRAKYTWVAEAMLFRELRDIGWDESHIAKLYKMKVTDIRELIAMLDDAEQFLVTRQNLGKYSLVQKKEYAFRQLQKMRKNCGEDESRKQLLMQVTYLMLDEPDTADGRLYESIPDAFKYLDDIATNIKKEFPDRIIGTNQKQDNFEILGGAITHTSYEVVKILSESENAPKARSVINDTIEEMRALERERKDSAYCFRQVQQACTKLQSAASALSKASDTNGIEDALSNIESTITFIRDWLHNANNNA